MRIWAISDTHGRHAKLVVPPNIDMVIHAGDFANDKRPVSNLVEANDFIEWMRGLDIRYKVVTPGNHDLAVQPYGLKDFFDTTGIHLLVHRAKTIGGVRLFGSPYTPTYGTGWAYNKSRNRMQAVWNSIPEETDIVITHGPPKGILDLTEDKESKRMVQVGCKSLLNRIKEIQPSVHIFGHIHSESKADNHGVLIRDEITYINASCVKNRHPEVLYPGIVFEFGLDLKEHRKKYYREDGKGNRVD